MRLVCASLFALLPVSALARAGDEPREEIGVVLGEPVYRDQLQTAKGRSLRSEVHRLFLRPVWEQYLKENQAKLAPSEREIKALLGYFNKRREQERPKLEARLSEVNKQLSEKDLTDKGRRRLEAERTGLEARIKPLGRHFALFWLSHWKQQRLLYDQYGGGRVIWQQAGLEALDAMHAWLLEQEDKGQLQIHDPALRDLLYEYWTTMKHGVLNKEQVEKEFLNPPWLPLKRQAKPKKKAAVDGAASRGLTPRAPWPMMQPVAAIPL